MPNTEVIFTPSVVLNDVDCPLQPPTVTLWINDIVVDSVLYTGSETFTYSFGSVGTYRVKMCVENCCGICCSEEIEIQVGEIVQLQRLNCKEYQLVDNRNDLLQGIVTVTDLNGEVLATESMTGNILSINLSLDGIYIVKYDYILNDGLGERTISFCILEFCSLIYCFKDIFLKIVCDKKTCGNQELLERYYKLSIFTTAAQLFLGGNFSLWSNTQNTWIFEEKYLGLLTDLNKYLQSALVMCAECGTNLYTTISSGNIVNTNMPSIRIINSETVCCNG